MKKFALMTAVLCAVAMMGTSAFAASPLRAVGVEAGYVSPDIDGLEDANSTWVAGVFMDFGLPATNMYINPFVNYWSSSMDFSGSEVSFSDWTIGANLKYTIPTAGVISPFVAAGASAHLLNAESGSISEGDTKFGFQAGAGVKVGVSQSANLIGSGWYHMVEDANNWSARAGLAFSI